MAVLIKTMEMPKTCEDCNLESFCSLWADARKMDGSYERAVSHNEYGELKTRRSTIRHPDCPLIEALDYEELVKAAKAMHE